MSSFTNSLVGAPRAGAGGPFFQGQLVRISADNTVVLAQADILANTVGYYGVVDSGVVQAGGPVNVVSTGSKAKVLLETGLTPQATDTLFISGATAGLATNVTPAVIVSVGTIVDASPYAQFGYVWAVTGNSSSTGTGAQGATGSQGSQGSSGAQGSQGTQGAGFQGAAGATGVQGSQGAQGATGDRGNQGLSGQQGVQGSVGTQGLQGFQGTQGAGFQGTAGAAGAQGATGGAGAQGTTGAQGATGTTGAQGTAGASGGDGAQGAQGLQGSQGNQGTQGAGAQGAQGSQGAGGGAQGAAGPQGFQGSSSGAQGFQGSQGAAGSGAQGAAGAAGAQGNQGFQGRQGFQGVAGTGAQGAAGPQGLQGLQGLQGANGTTGAQGATGTGAQGAQGSQGAGGTTGAQGFQGVAGTGAQGAAGPQGSVGAQGATGGAGGTGLQGAVGAQGGTGAQGVQGAQGRQGFQGLQGATGTGLQGAQGFQGFQGVIGTTGAQGNQGLQGGPATETLAQAYNVGTTSANQTMTLTDAHGGAVIVDGTSGSFTTNTSAGSLIVKGKAVFSNPDTGGVQIAFSGTGQQTLTKSTAGVLGIAHTAAGQSVTLTALGTLSAFTAQLSLGGIVAYTGGASGTLQGTGIGYFGIGSSGITGPFNGTVVEFNMVPPSQVAATGTKLDAIKFDAITATFTTAVNITTAAGVNFIDIEAPTYTNTSAMTVSNGSTFTIKGAPIAGGSLVITNPRAFWVQQGAIQLDGIGPNGLTTIYMSGATQQAITKTGGNLFFGTEDVHTVTFLNNGNGIATVDSTGFVPTTTNTFNIGSATAVWATTWTNNVTAANASALTLTSTDSGSSGAGGAVTMLASKGAAAVALVADAQNQAGAFEQSAAGNGNFVFFGPTNTSFHGGNGVIYIHTATQDPAAGQTGGFYLYVTTHGDDALQLVAKGPDGVVTPLAFSASA